MAEGGGDNEDRNEDASDERRNEFREKGDIAMSRDITQVFVLAALMGLFAFYLNMMSVDLQKMMYEHFHGFDVSKISEKTVYDHLMRVGRQFLVIILPIFAVVTVVATFMTFFQTQLNWSWKKLAPKWERMNPISGLARMVNMTAVVEILKAVGKLTVIFAISYLILRGEMRNAPGLMSMPFMSVWVYWAEISNIYFWSVLGLLLFIGAGDFLYSYVTMEKKLKMTREEVKEEFKKREQDPYMKNRMKRMQREIATSKTIAATKTATVVITNPTHFAVAIRYELGMSAPVVVAKGQDFVAQRMKEVAKDEGILIMENKPLARTLFKVCNVGQEIPESLYKAVSEIIRYVFMLKGKNLSRPRR